MDKRAKHFEAMYQLLRDYSSPSEAVEMFQDLYEELSDIQLAKLLEEIRLFETEDRLPSYVHDFCPKSGGRYRPVNSKQVYKLSLLGARDKDLAEFFEVSVAMIGKWRKAHPAFDKAIKRGQMSADAEVAHAIFKKATGQIQVKKWKFVTHEGVISDEREYSETLPPSEAAGKWWLENRDPENWRNRTELDLRGDMNIHKDLSDDDLQLLLTQAGLFTQVDPLKDKIVKKEDK